MARNNRDQKQRDNERKIKEKFLEERLEKINNNPLKPMNRKQEDYINLIEDMDMVIATGLAGSSKTYIPTVMACDDYMTGNVDTIYITRPAISNSKSLGYFGGDILEKMSNWLGPVLSVMKERLGPAMLEIGIKHGDIQFIPFEVIKGYSFNDCYVILDEGEDITVEEAKKFVTRLGRNCKTIIAGDISQSELGERSGLRKLIELYDEHPELKSRVGHVDFSSPSDIVRSDLCRNWILAFRKDN